MLGSSDDDDRNDRLGHGWRRHRAVLMIGPDLDAENNGDGPRRSHLLFSNGSAGVALWW